jgi:hypothetical protein
VWDDCHTEHLARRAAEIGDSATEALADAVLAGIADADELIDLIEIDDAYADWMLRGSHLGWRTRAA